MSDLATAIDNLANLHAVIAQQISRLANLSTDDESVRAQLAAKIHGLLREADARAETAGVLLQNFKDDDSDMGPSSVSRVALAGRLYEVRQDLKLDRSSYRKAQLTSREATLKSARHERELLFAKTVPSSTASAPQQSVSSRTLHAAEDATASLRRTHQLLEAEIARSAISLDVLEESNTSLRKLTTQYTAFDAVLGTSRRVIAVLEQADKWDRIYMLAAIGLLLLVLAWIVWRRILKGPVRLVIWTAVKGGRAVTWAVSGSGRKTGNVTDILQSSKSAQGILASLEPSLPSSSSSSSSAPSLTSVIDVIVSTALHDEL
ncbi:Sec20-domain-containing protein [Limtongia smithiae]|uniref:Sec20-domain-containing protein n=1 Tax=Limtongia smithiae TaxID=1125753 RepID=UPI0034CE8594